MFRVNERKLELCKLNDCVFYYRTSYGSSIRYRSDTYYNLVHVCCSGYHDPSGGINCERKCVFDGWTFIYKSLLLRHTSFCI